VCCASTGFGWTVTAYTAVLSSAGMAQGFAGPARLLPDSLRVATGKVNAQTLCVGGRGEGADYDKLQRNMAESGFLRIKLLKTTWTF
jgi:hypothetical protein